MSSFKDPLILEDNNDGTFTLVNSFRYHLGALDNDIIITVPAGFKTDLASIPAICSVIVPKLGKHNKGAVVHDYLYQMVREGKFDRTISDAVFYEIMKISGVRFTQRFLIYIILRSFGWWAIKFSKPMNEAITKENVFKGII